MTLAAFTSALLFFAVNSASVADELGTSSKRRLRGANDIQPFPRCESLSPTEPSQCPDEFPVNGALQCVYNPECVNGTVSLGCAERTGCQYIPVPETPQTATTPAPATTWTTTAPAATTTAATTTSEDTSAAPLASRICVDNEAGFVLSWKMFDTRTHNVSRQTAGYSAGFHECLDLSSIPGIEPGHPVETIVFAQAGISKRLQPVNYHPGLHSGKQPVVVVFSCFGSTYHYSCGPVGHSGAAYP